jgi:hypothetical protein
VIKNLENVDQELGTNWLKGIVEHITDKALKIIPSIGKIIA